MKNKSKILLISASVILVGALIFLTFQSKKTLTSISKLPNLKSQSLKSSEPFTESKTTQEKVVSKSNSLSKKERAFLEMGNKMYKEFTTREKVKEMTEKEVHHTPPEFTEIGKKLSRLNDEILRDPTLKDVGVSFFKKCGLDRTMLNPTQTLCLALIMKHDLELAKSLIKKKFFSKQQVKSANFILNHVLD